MPDIATVLTTSSGVAADGTTSVVVRWQSTGADEGYTLYRRPAGGTGAWGAPLGGPTPVRVPASAAELLTIVTPAAPEWTKLRNGFTAAAQGTDPLATVTPVDPAVAFERGLTVAEATFVQAGAQTTVTMGRIAGLAYLDTTVTAEAHYDYELREVRAGVETVIGHANDVWAGHFDLPEAPQGLEAEPGDGRVLLLWHRPALASTFVVERASSPGGPFVRVNPEPVAYDLSHHLDGTELTVLVGGVPQPDHRPGYLDITAWDADGAPTTHLVAGSAVDGPHNGLTYWYRVASRDSLDRPGPFSPAVAASPVRSLTPRAPEELQVTPTTSADGLAVRWRTVRQNVEGHQFYDHGVPDGVQHYLVHRAPSREALEDLTNLSTYLVHTTPAFDPRDPTVAVQAWTDTDPVLVPPYGTTTFFYRVLARDQYGLVSAPSAVIGGTVPDTTPPGPTQLVSAQGAADHIHVEWKENPETDVAGYRVYRGVCDFGRVYVPGVSQPPRDPQRPDDKEQHGDGKDGPREDKGKFTCDLALVGDVPLGDARRMLAQDGVISFDDHSVPANSPICYAYWVRAYDFAENLYPGDGGGCPREGEYLCAALHEKTPPEPPVVTGMRARNDSVLLEWVGAPEQDLRAFHVYRSTKENDPPQFVACVFTDGSVSALPWIGLVPTCTQVPAVPNPLAARGQYLDTDVEPHREYWYRVAGVDWLGNESTSGNLLDIPASSTFTFTADLPNVPTIVAPVAPATTACGLDVAWEPPFDPGVIQGYVVSRTSAGSPSRQVSPVLQTTSYVDETARRGVDYYYVVQAIDLVGHLSEPSVPVLHRY